jgi:hypothetical protein
LVDGGRHRRSSASIRRFERSGCRAEPAPERSGLAGVIQRAIDISQQQPKLGHPLCRDRVGSTQSAIDGSKHRARREDFALVRPNRCTRPSRVRSSITAGSRQPIRHTLAATVAGDPLRADLQHRVIAWARV